MLIGTAMGLYNVVLDARQNVDEQIAAFSLKLDASDVRAILSEVEQRRVRNQRWTENHIAAVTFDNSSPQYRDALRKVDYLAKAVDDQIVDQERLIRLLPDLAPEEVENALKEDQGRVDYALREVRLLIEKSDNLDNGELRSTSCGSLKDQVSCKRDLGLFEEGIPSDPQWLTLSGQGQWHG